MLALAAHAHLAVVDDDVVLLDIAADRYLCVPGGREVLRPGPDLGVLSPAEADVADALRAAGLVAVASAVARRPAPARPSRDLPDGALPPLTLRDAARLVGALWDVLWRYRGRPLREVVAFAAARAAQATADDAADAADAVRLACVFRRAVVWLPLPRKCLIRSFALLCFLQRSGHRATWVFGVRTWPFSAHCWLQLGDLALDDHAERLVGYTPIFAVG